MNISQKLFLGFSSLTALVVLVSMNGLFLVQSLGTTTEQLVSDKLATKSHADSVVEASKEAISLTRKFVNNSENLSSIASEINTRFESFDHHYSYLESSMFASSAKDVRSLVSNLREGVESVIKAHQRDINYQFELSGQHYDVLSFALEMEVELNNWVNSLEQAVKFDTPVEATTSADQSKYKIWQESYKTEDEALAASIMEYGRANEKLHEFVVTLSKLAGAERKSTYEANKHATVVAAQNALTQLTKQASKVIQRARIQKSIALKTIEGDADKIDSEIHKLQEAVRRTVAISIANVVKTEKFAEKYFIYLMIASVLVTIAIGFYFRATISLPLQRIVERMADIAEGEGDLTKTLDINSQDELGKLAKTFNDFIFKLRQIICSTIDSTDSLIAAVKQMNSITELTQQSVLKQQQETDQVVSAVNEITATAADVARNAVATAEATTQAAESTSVGRQVSMETVSTIKTLAGEVGSMAEKIRKLATDSEGVSKALNVISSIAQQTNLLALNAAIEAARAGEVGRGFAVVADEVRSLAQRTQEFTKEIQASIGNLLEGARDAVATMEAGNQKAEQGVAQVFNTEGSLNTIASAVEQIRSMTDQIATAAEEQASVSDHIEKNMVTISVLAEETAQGARDTTKASERISGISYGLHQLVTRFKV